jgi:regulatory protein
VVTFPRSKKIYDPPALYEYAVAALGRRMRTVAELKRLLRQKLISGDHEAAIEAVITKLKDQKYLNDTRYAEMYSAFRKEGNKFGKQRVITDLKVKGVHGDVIEKSVSAAYAGVNEEQLARQYLARKRIKKPSVARRADAAAMKQSHRETARVFRTLVRAGFRTPTIIKVLKQWDVEDEFLTALEEETKLD